MNATAVATETIVEDGSWIRSTPGTPSAFMLASIGSALELPWVGRDKTPKQYANQGDTTGAIASITADIQSHPETKDHAALGLMMMLALGGHLNTPFEVRKFIEGFN